MATWTYIDNFIDNSPGSSWDKEHGQEIKSNLDGAIPTFASGNFSGAGVSTTVTIADQGNTDYYVTITPMTNAPAGIGEISVEIISSTEFKVYNSGGSTCSFKAIIFKN